MRGNPFRLGKFIVFFRTVMMMMMMTPYAVKVDNYCSELNTFMATQGLLIELPKPKGGRKTYHKRNNKKKKRTYKRRK